MPSIAIDRDKCVVCGLCIEVCDWCVLDTNDDDTQVVPIHLQECTMCMLCEEGCYEDAIKVSQ